MAAKNLPSKIKQILVTKLTSDFRDAVKVVSVPLPKVSAGQVLVKNKFVGINASDINFTSGKYLPGTQPPFPAGFEAVGKVVDVGENVSSSLIGKSIAHMTPGAFSEYQLVKSSQVFPVPTEKPEYLPLLVSGMTASLALKNCADLKPSDKVLVTAAAGGTGQFAVQLAKLAGCHVIGTCSSDEKCKFLQSIGCDHAINLSKKNLNAELKERYPDGVDVVYESIGGDVYDTCINRLAEKGRLIVIGYISGYQKPMGVGMSKSARAAAALPVKLLMKSARVQGFFLFHYADQYKETVRHLSNLLHNQQIKSTVDLGSSQGGFTGIESVSDAVEYLYSKKNIGKIVVDISGGAGKSKL